MIKKFESFGNNVRGWEDDLFLMYDAFVDIHDDMNSNISDFAYQAGFRSSNGNISYGCYLDTKSGKIEGNKEVLNQLISINSKIVLRFLFSIKLKGYSPFSQSSSSSYYGEDADLFLKVMSYIDSVKNKLSHKYNIAITLVSESDWFRIDFLEK
jgi:hypothetical protein